MARRHGTVSNYIRGHCRCDECTMANANRGARNRRRLRERGLPPGDRRHGTLNGYSNWGCRCDKCRKVQSVRMVAYRRTA